MARGGFTLIELMVTIAVLVVLVTVGVPSFQTTLDNRRILGAAEALAGELHYARTVAIRAGVVATVNPGVDGDWLQILIDEGDDRDLDRRLNGARFVGVTIDWIGWEDVTGDDDGIRIDPVRGLAQDEDGNLLTGVARILLTSARGREMEVRLNPIGRAWICQPNGGARYAACTNGS